MDHCQKLSSLLNTICGAASFMLKETSSTMHLSNRSSDRVLLKISLTSIHEFRFKLKQRAAVWRIVTGPAVMKHTFVLIFISLIVSACASYDSSYQQRYVYRDGSYYYPAGDGYGDYYTDDDPYRHSYYDPDGWFWGSGYYSSGYSGCRLYSASRYCSPWRYRHSWYPDRYYRGSGISIGFDYGRGYWTSPYYNGFGHYGGYGGYRSPYGYSYPYRYGHGYRPQQGPSNRIIPMPKPSVFVPPGSSSNPPPITSPIAGPRVEGEYRWPDARRYRQPLPQRYEQARPMAKPQPVFIQPTERQIIETGPSQMGEAIRDDRDNWRERRIIEQRYRQINREPMREVRPMAKPMMESFPSSRAVQANSDSGSAVIQIGAKGPARIDENEP